MRNRIDIDSKHSRAIVQEIGERLRAFLQEEPEPPESLRTQINRLRELEEQSPSIIPRWLGQASLLSRLGQHRRSATWARNAIGEAPCVKNLG